METISEECFTIERSHRSSCPDVLLACPGPSVPWEAPLLRSFRSLFEGTTSPPSVVRPPLNRSIQARVGGELPRRLPHPHPTPGQCPLHRPSELPRIIDSHVYDFKISEGAPTWPNSRAVSFRSPHPAGSRPPRAPGRVALLRGRPLQSSPGNPRLSRQYKQGKEREPTSGLEPLTCPLRVSYAVVVGATLNDASIPFAGCHPAPERGAP
jgi:hypothetical protein